MTQLSTRLTIPDISDNDLDLVVEYSYSPRTRELVILEVEACLVERVPVWHLLSQRQRDLLEDRCREDYVDRMDGVRETRYEERHV